MTAVRERVVYERDRAGPMPVTALGHLLFRVAWAVGRSGDGSPKDWGVPAALLRPLAEMHVIACRFADERLQTNAVFNSEDVGEVAPTQWHPLVLAVNSRAIEAMRELVAWMQSVETNAKALDEATAAVAEGRARVDRDENGNALRIVVLELGDED